MPQYEKAMHLVKIAVQNNSGKLSIATGSADEMLQQLARGAYTAARTVQGTKVFRFSQHLQRLSNSIIGLSPEGSYIPNDAILKDKVVNSICDTYDYLCKQDKTILENNKDIRFTIHFPVPIIENTFDFNVHMSVMPGIRPPPIYVNLYNKPREHALVKDSQWVKNRSVIYSQLASDIEEILLYTNEGEVLEGSQSNCFIIQDGTIHTANEGILNGTVREMVLHLIRKYNIPLSFEPCNIHDINKWEGAFITSTSRWIMNINAIKENDQVIKSFDKNPLIEQLEEGVASQINEDDNSRFKVTYAQAEKIAEAIYELGQNLTCPVCLSLLQNPQYMPCNHAICLECGIAALRVHKECPLCRIPCNKRMLNPANELAEIIDAYKTLHPPHRQQSVSSLSQPDTPETLINTIQATNPQRMISINGNDISQSNSIASKQLPKQTEEDIKNGVRFVDTPTKLKSLSTPLPQQHCYICGDYSYSPDTTIPRLCCSKCHICVHSQCYGYQSTIDPANWFCDLCRNNDSNVTCYFCKYSGTVMREITVNNERFYIHMNCARYMFLLTVVCTPVNTPLYIKGIEEVMTDTNVKRCYICKRNNGGITIKCSEPGCKSIFHVYCACNEGLYMYTDTAINVPYIYCHKHSDYYRTKNSLLPVLEKGDKYHIYISTGLNKEERRGMNLFINKYKYTLIDQYRKEVQVCIISCKEEKQGKDTIYIAKSRTMKYMLSLLGKKYIVAYQYIHDSIEKRELQDISKYEVYGDAECRLLYSYIPKRYRSTKDLLFTQCSLYLYGRFFPPAPSKDDIARLIHAGGGELLADMNELSFYSRRNYIVICDTISPDLSEEFKQELTKSSVHVVTFSWLLDSISNIQLCDYVKYAVHC
ncbi:hypothetical protein WA158_005043 [Blastocystis sp. Blastoise]